MHSKKMPWISTKYSIECIRANEYWIWEFIHINIFKFKDVWCVWWLITISDKNTIIVILYYIMLYLYRHTAIHMGTSQLTIYCMRLICKLYSSASSTTNCILYNIYLYILYRYEIFFDYIADSHIKITHFETNINIYDMILCSTKVTQNIRFY